MSCVFLLDKWNICLWYLKLISIHELIFNLQHFISSFNVINRCESYYPWLTGYLVMLNSHQYTGNFSHIIQLGMGIYLASLQKGESFLALLHELQDWRDHFILWWLNCSVASVCNRFMFCLLVHRCYPDRLSWEKIALHSKILGA